MDEICKDIIEINIKFEDQIIQDQSWDQSSNHSRTYGQKEKEKENKKWEMSGIEFWHMHKPGCQRESTLILKMDFLLLIEKNRGALSVNC